MRNLAVLVLMLFLTACGAAEQSSAAASEHHQTAGDAQAGYQRVMAASTIDGDRMDKSDSATVMVVFASWCHACQKELATLGELRDAYPELRIIGLNAYEEFRNYSDQERLAAYLETNAPWLREIVHAGKGLLNDFGGVPKIPTLFVYDRQGNIVAEFRRNQRRAPTYEELEEAILQALQR